MVGLQIAEARTFQVDFSGETGGATLVHCDGPAYLWSSTTDPTRTAGRVVGSNTSTYSALEQGKYSVLAHGHSSEEPATVTVNVQHAAFPTASCIPESSSDVVEPIHLDITHDGLHLRADQESPAFLAFRVESQREAQVLLGTQSIALCDSACNCDPLQHGVGQTVLPGRTYWLSVDPSPDRRVGGIELLP
jgi:hypothetical protein